MKSFSPCEFGDQWACSEEEWVMEKYKGINDSLIWTYNHCDQMVNWKEDKIKTSDRRLDKRHILGII